MDFKASIVLALEAAVFTVIVSMGAVGGPLHDLHDVREALFRCGVCVIGAAGIAAGIVVMPQLGRRAAKRDWAQGLIYFGHLRHWDPDRLADQLRSADRDDVAQLARQMVAMSRVAWRKHVCLQWSLALLAVGIALLTPAGVQV